VMWKVETRGGERREQTVSIGTDEFDAVWKKIDSTGWRNLGDCDSEGGDTDPVYVFGIADNWSTKEISCTAQQLPFPYDAIVNELDQKAAEHGD
jgi:hypothetical protein